jgi:hypothetical protein
MGVKIPLSPVDRCFVGPGAYSIEMSFCFSSRLSLAALQQGLERIQKAWPLLGAIVRYDDQDAHLDFSQPHSLHVEERTTAFEPDLSKPEDWALLKTQFTTGGSDPLLRAVLFQTPTRSWLSVALAHALGDGYSYFLFLSEWARACHGQQPTAIKTDRSAIAGTAPGKAPQDLPIEEGPSRERFEQETGVGELEYFSDANIAEQIKRAGEEAGTRLSFHDWYCADRWKKTVEPLRTNPERSVVLLTPIDFRRYRKADLGPLYFGNAVCFATIRASVGEVLSASVPSLALRVQQAVRSSTVESIQEQINNWVSRQKTDGLKRVHHWNLIQPGSPTLVTNLSALPLQKLVFGSAGETPLGVRYTGLIPGLSVVMPKTPSGIEVQSVRVNLS